jgi:hypothetical protein
MERSGTSRAIRGLWIDVDGPTMPQMRVEIAPPRQLRIVQGDETVMLGWVDPGHLGVEFLRTGSFESAVAPIPASEARRRGEVDDAERWFSGWCHEFVDALESSDIAPLHAGSWTLRPAQIRSERTSLSPVSRAGTPAVDPNLLEYDDRLLVADRSGYVDWRWSGSGAVLPLRPLSPPDAGRVKAHRKLVRDGVLPVLVWWLGGLSCSVIIDGHDRFAASIAEGVAPPLIELLGVRSPDDDRRVDGEVGRTLEELLMLAEDGDTSSGRARAVGAALAAAQLRAELRARTLAWPLPGGSEAWLAEAMTSSPAWVDQLRATVSAQPQESSRLDPSSRG